MLLRVGLTLLGTVSLLSALATTEHTLGGDTISYWTIDLNDLYGRSATSTAIGAWRYSPVLAQLMVPLTLLPWAACYLLVLAVSLLALTTLGGRLGLALILIPNVVGELYHGNIDLWIAASLGFGLVFPPAWAFLALSKATPAVVVLWFVVRREWRNLGLVLGTVAVVAVPSLILTPGLWVDWYTSAVRFATTSYGMSDIPALPRIAAAAVLVGIGASRGWKWTIAIGGMLAVPGFVANTQTIALAILPLYGLGLRADLPGLRRRFQFHPHPERAGRPPGP